MIVPTTFEPGQESGFTLRVFSRKPLKLKLVDTVPMLRRWLQLVIFLAIYYYFLVVNPAVVTAPLLLDGKSFSQYEAVFLQLADEHRSVNAFELQELLDACLPNDYIKSCASLEVCRQIVFAFEVSILTLAKNANFSQNVTQLAVNILSRIQRQVLNVTKSYQTGLHPDDSNMLA